MVVAGAGALCWDEVEAVAWYIALWDALLEDRRPAREGLVTYPVETGRETDGAKNLGSLVPESRACRSEWKAEKKS
jgi:hypothetical protein